MTELEAYSWVLIADGARARLFEVRRPDDEDYDAGPRLRERVSLVHPEGRLTGTDLFANTNSGRHRAPRAGPAHGLDSHRSRHEAEYERRFADVIAETVAELVETHGIRRLIVVAAPSMLGQLRPALSARLPARFRVEEMPRDVSWHALTKLEQLLERRGLIAPRAHSDAAYVPAGQPPARL